MNEKEIIRGIRKLNKEIQNAKELRSLYLVDGKEFKWKEILIQVSEEHYSIFADLLDLYQKEKEKNKVIEIFRKDMPEDTELVVMRKEDFDRNFGSEYIHKDKIKYYYKKICASVNHFQSKDNNNIVLRIKKYLEKLLEEGD